jgi:hypothetical protein
VFNIVVMGDVIAPVYTFHSPLSSKVDLSLQRGCNVYFINSSLLVYWLFLICGVASNPVFVSYRCVLVLLGVLWFVPAYWWSYYALG